MRLMFATTLILAACKGGEPTPTQEGDTDTDADTDTDTDTDADTDTDTDTDTDADTDTDTDADTDTEPLPTIDCATLPDSPLSTQILQGPRGYHGLVIDANGMMVGATQNGTLVTADRTTRSPWIPNIGEGEQLDYLPNGDLVAVDGTEQMVRITPTGSVQPIGTSVSPYAVEVGPDGMIYATNNYWVGTYAVWKIDPATGTSTEIAPNFVGWSDDVGNEPHALRFNAAGTRMYVASIGDGTIYYVDFDAQMNPILPPQIYATIGNGDGMWQDAIAIDVCGNMYIPDYYSSDIYKVRPDGSWVVYFDAPADTQYAHGLTWGNGQNGWDEQALYAPLPYGSNQVLEIVVGAPSQHYTGPVVNGPATPP